MATVDDIRRAGFNISKTGQNIFHYTVELDNPVTPEVASRFNSVFVAPAPLMQDPEVAKVALDSSMRPQVRIAAIQRLAAQSVESSIQALLVVANRVDDDPEVLAAAGSGLAQLSESLRRITEFEMRDMSERAYLAFAEWLP